VKEDITDKIIWDHLTGQSRVGIYPLVNDRTFWIAVDFDDDDLDKVRQFHDKCREYGIPSYIERSKSKGYHVWIWFSEPVQARKARLLARNILDELGPDFSGTELFPKQDFVDADRPYGNYINLPFFGKRSGDEGRTIFLDPETGYQPYSSQWAFLSSIRRLTSAELDGLVDSHGINDDSPPECPANMDGAGTTVIGDGDLERVLECDFIIHCRDNAADLSEPFWYAMISNLCRFHGGREKIHELSSAYPEYSESETEAKIDHARAGSGPITCEKIREDGFHCPRYDTCGVKSPAGLTYINDKLIEIQLSQIEDAEFDGSPVTTELMIAGTGATYGVPREVTISWQERDGDKMVDRTRDFVIPRDSRLLLDCYKQGDGQLKAILRKALIGDKVGGKVDIGSRYTLREILAVPKIQRATEGETGDYEYRNFIIYYVDDVDPDVADSHHAGIILRSNVFYRAAGIAMTEPKRQQKTMLVTELEQLDSPWQAFRMTGEIEEQFQHFRPEDNSVEGIRAKLVQIAADVTRNITKRYGAHRERMLLVNLLTLSSPISCCFDGERKPGWLEVMIIGDTAQAKTSLLKNLLDAINLGQLVGGSSTSRTGLIYSLDTKINDKRILVWGAFAHNNGGFLAIDEAHKLQEGEWSELTEVRSNGEIDVNRAVRGRHPAEVRQVYLANPPSDRPMSHFYCGIEAIKGMMRAEDIRRFDLVMIVAKGDDPDGEFLRLDMERDAVPQVFTPELLRHHVCWAWQLSGDAEWTPEAKQEVKAVSQHLYSRYGGAVDIPLVLNDIRDKVCKLAQAVAALLHSTTDDPLQLRILPEHIQIVRDDIFDAIYSHNNCRLDEYAQNARNETELDDEDYIAILEDIQEMKSKELDGSTTDSLLDSFRSSNLITLKELMEILGLGQSAVSKRTSMLKTHGLVKSSRNGYYKTPKFIAFLRRLDASISDADTPDTGE